MRDIYKDFGYNPKEESAPTDIYQDFNYQPEEKHPEQSFLNKAIDYEKGLGLGLAQHGGDIGASVLNAPGELYKHFKGKELYHVPHPSLQQYYPTSSAGKTGSSIGEMIPNFAIPGGAALKGAGAVANPLIKMLMGALGGGTANALANEGSRVESGITGAELGALPGVASTIGAVGKSVGKFATGLKSEDVAPLIQKAHDVSLANAVEPLNKASEMAAKLGAPAIKLSKDLIQKSEAAFPKTEKYRLLIEQAKNGDHDAIRGLQTALGDVERGLLAEGTHAGTNYGQEVGQLRKDINNTMYKTYEKEGFTDLADMVKQGMKDYEQHAGLYYEHPTINKLVGKQKLVPENLLGTLKENSAFMNKFRETIPGLDKKLANEDMRRKVYNSLKYAGIGTGLLGGGNVIKEWSK